MSIHTAADSAPASARILRTAASALERFRPFSTFCSAISMYVFLGMVALTFLDVVLRTTIDRPISGTIEITELLMVVMFFGSVAHAQWNHAHVNMDIITSRLSKTGENRLGFATDLWSLVIVVFCIKTMIDYAFKSSTLVTPTWHIHFLPFILYAAAGCALIVIALLHDVLTRLADALERDSAAGVCAMLCLALIPLALGILFAMHRTPLSQAIPVGILGLVFMFALFFMGMPIAYALMAAAFIFICTLRGPGGAFNLLGKTWFTTVASYNWSPLMFFLLMGYLCFYSQFGQDLFRCFRAWMGHARGGLAHGSVAACTAFGAVVGDNVACNVAMTTIALPEMRRNGYDDSLSVGTLAASGTIGSLIPPSTSFIIYGVLADQSIGDLFMAGVLPGITCMLCFMLVIWYRVWRNPALGPASPAVSGTEKAKSLIMALPILLIFVVAIGGIYAGLFTATEGGGIGAFATLAFALALAPLYLEEFFRGSDFHFQGHHCLFRHSVRRESLRLFRHHEPHSAGAGHMDIHHAPGRILGHVRHHRGHELPGLLHSQHPAHPDLHSHVSAHRQRLPLGSHLVRRHHGAAQEHGRHHAALRHQPLRGQGAGGHSPHPHVPGHSALCYRSLSVSGAHYRLPPPQHLAAGPDALTFGKERTMQRVGFIGLGRMGGPCVRNLLKKGYEVRIWARSPEKARHLVEAGAVLCGSPAAAAAEADIFLTCVTAGPDVEDILLGEDGVCRGARPGLICADMSTISVSAARNLAERVAAHGAFFLDAPVSGGVRAAESGTLAIWGGGRRLGLCRGAPRTGKHGDACPPSGTFRLRPDCQGLQPAYRFRLASGRGRGVPSVRGGGNGPRKGARSPARRRFRRGLCSGKPGKTHAEQ